MKSTSNPVILDSSGLISLLNTADSLHEEALAISTALDHSQTAIILPYEVFAESMNVLGNKVGHQAAIQAGKALLARYQSNELILPAPDPALLETALDLLPSQRASVSFIDCLVMVMAKQYTTDQIFGFDTVFQKNGYHLPDGGHGRKAA